uniref:DUF7824 domain-containing protein n=1 Tax=Herbidospora sakaeratensis TaxID=564415 RepID=UPI000781DB39|nr:DUF6493 family protein [Herbidospora sakaeratensis]
MSSWQQWINDVPGLRAHLAGLDEPERKAVAAELPGYLTDRWEVAAQARAFRLLGAACFSGAAQVAAWLDRRELREPRPPRADAADLLLVLQDRKDEWRRDLAHRLVARLRPSRARGWRNVHGQPGWDLAASLVIETGIEPPENDAFVTGWLWDLCHRLWTGETIEAIRDHPLLDVMIPRLFQAEGVTPALTHDWTFNTANHNRSIISGLAELAAEGRLERQVLIDGCIARFLTHGQDRQIEPFVHLWNTLRPTSGEVSAVDLARVLPVAAAPLARLAAEELRRLDDSLDPDLFAETVAALAFRPEKKHVTTALQWIAEATPERADGALAALAPVFGQETPSLRDRSVRLALKLAPHATPATVGMIREAAEALPADLRARIAGAFGEVAAPPVDSLVPGTLRVKIKSPRLPPEIDSVDELARQVAPGWRRWEPMEVERLLAALVALIHRDRAATTEAVRPWWEQTWAVHHGSYLLNDFYLANYPTTSLHLCALAIISPADSVRRSQGITDYLAKEPPYRTPLDWVVRDRIREVVGLLESGRTLPVLLATPTAPTGHIDPATLVGRMELLGDHEPLPLDFCQALLRLPRAVEPEAVVRAEKLTTSAGRRLAAWLREGGPADPDVNCGIEAVLRTVSLVPEVHARLTPPAQDLPERLGDLWTLEPQEFWGGHSDEIQWWPELMPSHREVLAAHLLECFVVGVPANRAKAEVLTRFVQGEGPVGRATASAIMTALGHKKPAQRVFAIDAMKILAVRGEFSGADFGWALGQLTGADTLKLKWAAPALEELTLSGMHGEMWAVFAEALPVLLPRAGSRPATGLAELLDVAIKAATLAGARGELPRLAGFAARKGGSQVVEKARLLLRAMAG